VCIFRVRLHKYLSSIAQNCTLLQNSTKTCEIFGRRRSDGRQCRGSRRIPPVERPPPLPFASPAAAIPRCRGADLHPTGKVPSAVRRVVPTEGERFLGCAIPTWFFWVFLLKSFRSDRPTKVTVPWYFGPPKCSMGFLAHQGYTPMGFLAHQGYTPMGFLAHQGYTPMVFLAHQG